MGYPTPEDVAATAQYFDLAVTYIQALPKTSKSGADPTTTEQKLAFYALFKQANEGPLSTTGKARPGMFDPQGKYKYDAWASLGDCSPDAAKAQYVDLVAMSIIVGNVTAPSEAEFYAERLASPDCPELLKLVLAPASGSSFPRMWALAKSFADAAASAAKLTLSGTDAVILKGLYMQALYGDVYTERPGLMDRLAGVMTPEQWDAWNAQKGKAKDTAIETYILKVETLAEA